MKTEFSTCHICPRNCTLVCGQTGICGARKNNGGKIVCENYGKITAIALDPIEKKPLRRFFPGTFILSVGSYGCNLHCPFCQNHRIAKPSERFGIAGMRATDVRAIDVPTMDVPPEALVENAVSMKSRGNIGIAYTYNEPLIGYEYVMDCARLARSYGLKNVLVTNGYISEQPLIELLPFIDAMNIDLKSFSPEFYKKLGGNLEIVKNTISLAAEKAHIEVTTLIIPDENDNHNEIENLSSWLSEISSKINNEIPLHISRFFPCYKYIDKTPTSLETIHTLASIARKHLRHVYTGNV